MNCTLTNVARGSNSGIRDSEKLYGPVNSEILCRLKIQFFPNNDVFLLLPLEKMYKIGLIISSAIMIK